MECISLAIFHYTILRAYYADYYILIKLQFDVPEVKAKRKDNAEIRSKVSSLTPEDRKRLGINKSTLEHIQKHIKEGERIKIYAKIVNKLDE